MCLVMNGREHLIQMAHGLQLLMVLEVKTVVEKVTTFGPSDVTIIDGNGQSVTLDAWETTDVNQC